MRIIEYFFRSHAPSEEPDEGVSRLYAEQRSIAQTLRHALLPQELPTIPGMEIAVRYIPGVSGLDVGGDWYDVVPLGDGQFVFVVGDVSGRGVPAASVMASLRFASRGFALEGHGPAAILEQLAKILDVGREGRFATVLCGLVDVGRHRLNLVNAGHLPPVVCNSAVAEVLPTTLIPPIGVWFPPTVEPTVVTLGPRSTLLAYTDGLIERRGEQLDESIERLRESAVRDSVSLDDLLGGIVTELTIEPPHDDAALIGLRWLN